MNRQGPSIFVALVFGAMLLSAGGIQLGIELSRGERPRMFELFAHAPRASQLRAYEAQLESDSWLAQRLRPWMQYAQFILLNDPGEKAVRGRDSWFFYRPGLEYLTQRMPADPGLGDPVTAILDFRDQLAGRGIHLVVVPAPNKESVYPEQLTRRAEALPLAVGKATRSVLAQLRSAGVEVVDLFELYGGAKPDLARGEGLYLVQDSHWSPLGVEFAARAVAERLLERGWVEPGETDYAARYGPHDPGGRCVAHAGRAADRGAVRAGADLCPPGD